MSSSYQPKLTSNLCFTFWVDLLFEKVHGCYTLIVSRYKMGSQKILASVRTSTSFLGRAVRGASSSNAALQSIRASLQMYRCARRSPGNSMIRPRHQIFFLGAWVSRSALRSAFRFCCCSNSQQLRTFCAGQQLLSLQLVGSLSFRSGASRNR